MSIFSLEKEVVIHDYEAGLFYKNGEFKKILENGVYKVTKKGFKKEIIVIDKRIKSFTISGQEILTKDKLNLRLNILVRFRVDDPLKAYHEVENYTSSIYEDVQMVVRGVIGDKDLDDLVSIKNIFDETIKKELHSKSEKYGVTIESLECKDLILPGNVKAILQKEIEAKKNSEIELIKARSEVASTRALINAANLIKEHPEILKLKLIDSIEKLSKQGNSTIIPLPSNIFDMLKK
ncbi:MAG: slipin family protein [ANME-2 cluster archaeon]|nr:slipin family protein [ANME-2 cluster archaeon]